MFSFPLLGCLLASVLLVQAVPTSPYDAGSSKQLTKKEDNATSAGSTSKLVFCHFMMGIVANRASASDYDSDMKQAKELGIDAFALNIGTDSFTGDQLSYAYESAANNDMKVFISFDFNWFSPTSDAAKVGEMIAKYSKEPGQLLVDGKAFASSFSGDGLDVPAVKIAAGIDLFFAPNFSPNVTPDPDSIDGALNWMGWNTNGDNKAPTNDVNVTVVDGDDNYRSWLSQKSYIAPISPWFSTHYGAEVSYSKNFVFPSDLLWYTRWNDVLTASPEFVEIITWNDYGESHYIGPLSSTHDDDGASKWVNDMPHDGWRDVAKPFIAAYKAGSTSVDEYITEDKIVYWYRPAPRTVNCDSTDNTMKPGNNDSGNYFEGLPNGWGDMKDSVFVVTLLTSEGSVTVTSGDNTKTFDAPAGASSFEVPMGVGQQKFSLTRDSKTVLSGTSLKDIIDSCPCGIYNFNAYVGTLPERTADPLGAAGLASFTVGLAVETCSATPSLATAASVATTSMPTGVSVTLTATGVVPTGASQATTPTGALSTTAITILPSITLPTSPSISIPNLSSIVPTLSSLTIPLLSTTTALTLSSTVIPNSPSTIIPAVSSTTVQAASSTTVPAAPSTIIPALSTTTKPIMSSATTVPSSTASQTEPAASSASGAGDQVCNAGTNALGQSSNFAGLCSFSCSQGYCPPGPCVCTAYGAPISYPVIKDAGCPTLGEHDGYKGLCAFSCARDYCPTNACATSCG